MYEGKDESEVTVRQLEMQFYQHHLKNLTKNIVPGTMFEEPIPDITSNTEQPRGNLEWDSSGVTTEQTTIRNPREFPTMVKHIKTNSYRRFRPITRDDGKRNIAIPSPSVSKSVS